MLGHILVRIFYEKSKPSVTSVNVFHLLRAYTKSVFALTCKFILGKLGFLQKSKRVSIPV